MKTQFNNLSLQPIYQWPFFLRMITLIILGIILFLLGYLLLINHKNYDLKKEISQTSFLKKSLDTTLKKQIILKDEIKFMNDLSKKFELSKNNYSVNTLIQLLSQFAERYHIEIVSLKPESNDHLGSDEIKAVIKGNYFQFADFIAAISRLNYPIEFKKIEIFSSKNAAERSRLDMNLDIHLLKINNTT